MTVREFADKYLAPYKLKGNEVIPERCPFCHGGEHGDKYTFALNAETGAYNCKRGTCGVQGAFPDLLQNFGLDPSSRQGKTSSAGYKRPQGKVGAITIQGLNYLKRRGISQETAKAYRVGEDGKGNLVFPFYDETMRHVFTKYRPARDVKPGERKSWRDKDTKPILYGMQLCDPEYPLCIFEGELDAMSGYEAGLPNCVSVPSGAQDFTWIDTCWAFLERFKSVYLFGDNDEPGQQMQQTVMDKLVGWNLFEVIHECKDANELLVKKGVVSLLTAYAAAKEAPVYGLLDLGEIEPYDPAKAKRVLSGIPTLDHVLGGFQYGDLTVWTGRRGEGKSTMMNQIALEALDRGEKVCLYSGELSAQRAQYWLDLQAAGPEHIKATRDRETGKEILYVVQPQKSYIHDWYKGRMFVYDNTMAGAGEEDSILKAFHAAVSRKNCSVFIVDNLMTARLAKSRDGFFQAQSAFVGRLVDFAAKRNVVVHLVAHPRKGSESIKGDDIAGTGDIANRAANVISMGKTSENEGYEFDVGLSVLKNRWEGITCTVGLNYDKVSRRLFAPSCGNRRRYSWGPTQEELPVEDLPFEE